MVKVLFMGGLHVPSAGLWLDPRGRRDFAFVSHAHSDHTGRHGTILATPATAALARARDPACRAEFIELPYGQRRQFERFAATLIPAGHVLGSAQIHIECEDGDLLYTGDFKRRAGRSTGPAAAVHAETLVMETTYGLPRYRFPAVEESFAAVRAFCAGALEDGQVPVLLGYSLGKAQEILAGLCGEGFPILVHKSITAVAEVYRRFGVGMAPFAEWDGGPADGHVLVCPPAATGSRAYGSLARKRVAALTGWAVDSPTVHRMGVDEAIVLSDHAGYGELLEHVAEVAPSRVLTLHGFAQEFARDLRARGVDAWALTGPNQLEWEAMASPGPLVSPKGLPELRAGGFEAFSAVCEDIRRASGQAAKCALLASFLRGLRSHELRHIAVWFTGRAFPPADTRTTGLDRALLEKALAGASGLPREEVRALARSGNGPGQTAADVMARREGPVGSHAIARVAAAFAAMASKRNPCDKTDILSGLLRDMHPSAAGCLAGIVAGDLRLGLHTDGLTGAIAAAFGSDPLLVHDVNMLTSDPGATAAYAAAGKLEEAGLTLFQTLCPMPATSAGDIPSPSGLPTPPFWTEPLLHGIRAQIHAKSGQAEIYAHDGRTITGLFPAIATAACLIHTEAVLDGHIITWTNGRPDACVRLPEESPTGDLFEPRPDTATFTAFDLPASGGATHLRKPLAARRAILAGMSLPDLLDVVPVSFADSLDSLRETAAAAHSAGHRGIIVKDPTSPYAPGRPSGAWIAIPHAGAACTPARA
jgi:DNA ligase 1